MPHTAAEYGYLTGKILGAPGCMRITVAPEKVTADLVRSYLPEKESAGRKNHEVAFSYTAGPVPTSPRRAPKSGN